MKRFDSATLLTLAILSALGACSSGGNSAVGETKTGGDFVVLKTDPTTGATIYLNDPISLDFSNAVDIDSASLTTMSFQALDQLGDPTQELVTGSFFIGTATGDTTPGRRLQFVPRFATNNTYDDGGFKSGRTYLVQLIGGSSANGTVLRDTKGKALAQPITFTFSTREGTTPAQLFRNPKTGGPVKQGLEVSTASSLNNVPLGLFGAPPIEVRLQFDQALNPNDFNVPVNFDTNPLVRDINDRGRVFLEYDDPEYGTNTWIPTDAELERNDLTGATLVLRPVGVLPNNATIRVIVEPTLEDISGESNQGNLSYDRIFATFTTEPAYGQQWNGIVENFTSTENIDLGASFPESQAEVGPGFVKAGFGFEGKQTTLEYEPTAAEVLLNTAFTQIVPKQGLPFTVSGGVFNFKNVTIPQGVTVKGTGPNPMVWLCTGDFIVSGTLTVRGGNGAAVNTLNSAGYAKAGGPGVCGGGNGGDGTPSATNRDMRGGQGRGPLQAAAKGGRGGYVACVSGCYTGSGYNGSGGGSGGGGGAMATRGDPYWRGSLTGVGNNPNVAPSTNTAFQQRLGYGGAGCSGGSGSRSGFLLGGEPGDLAFADTRSDNNYWGSAIDVARNLRITGELTVPMGGGGGGGGGDTSPTFNCTLTGNNPTNDYSGGGGGGGGGALIVKALGEIIISSTGHIIADGGHGGGGEQAGSCGEAGGGGAGAGGMVVLMSAKRIIIEPHGNSATNRFVYGAPSAVATATHPYLRDDYDFAISADGGVCTTGAFGSIQIQNKYPATGQAMMGGTTYDGEPLGALGGMGIVQLMVPPGENLSDGTNTRLDDNIEFRQPGATPGAGTLINGEAKRQLLGWRGFPTGTGTYVNDANAPLNLGDNEGDIRPAPLLLPVPFQPTSRVRSKWLDLGAAERRSVGAGGDALPRGIDTSAGAVVGPKFEFSGTQPNGYIDFQSLGSTGILINYLTPVSATPIASIDANASHIGKAAYKIVLQSAVLGDADRYVQYEAELLNSADSLLAGYRIVSHTAQELLVDPETTVLPDGAVKLRVRAKFFRVATGGSDGLGGTYAPDTSTPAVPIANVRFGFAFHTDPGSASGERYPAVAQDFVRDLSDPVVQNWIAANHPRYVQWDITFNMTYAPAQSVSPSSPRPEIHFLRLPFRF
ncbi:MAG: Ig-like domain-containing protein [Planctomycetes bacterium]|nr:Ig-like domain-containing protein [Planctomycetota bacterium]